MSSRNTSLWRMRRFVGSVLQSWAWRLCDSHDNWAIQYHTKEGDQSIMIRTGFYSMAMVSASEVGGVIIGYQAGIIECDAEHDEDDNEGEEWKDQP